MWLIQICSTTQSPCSQRLIACFFGVEQSKIKKFGQKPLKGCRWGLSNKSSAISGLWRLRRMILSLVCMSVSRNLMISSLRLKRLFHPQSSVNCRWLNRNNSSKSHPSSTLTLATIDLVLPNLATTVTLSAPSPRIWPSYQRTFLQITK